MKNTNPDFLNGVPELLVLQLLARRPMYGYELVRAIEQSTGQVLEFGEGCIYPVLHRLEKDEFLAARRETVNGRSRVVYRTTAAGANGWPAALPPGEALWGQSIKFCWENMMQNQQLREKLAAELRRQSLPARYVERLLAEWDDHLADLEDERNIDMPKARTPESNSEKSQTAEIYDFQQRMGDPAQLAAFAAKQYRNRSFLGRHPMLTFLVLPLPLIVLGITAVMVAMYPIGTALDYYWPVSNYHHPWLLGPVIAIIFWILIVMPPLCSMLLLCRIARRNLVKMRWVVMASVIIAMYCADFHCLESTIENRRERYGQCRL